MKTSIKAVKSASFSIASVAFALSFSALASPQRWPEWFRQSSVVRLSETVLVHGAVYDAIYFASSDAGRLGRVEFGNFDDDGLLTLQPTRRRFDQEYALIDGQLDIVISIDGQKAYVIHPDQSIEMATSGELSPKTIGRILPMAGSENFRNVWKPWSNKGLIRDIVPPRGAASRAPRTIRFAEPLVFDTDESKIRFDAVKLEKPFNASTAQATLGLIAENGDYQALSLTSWAFVPRHYRTPQFLLIPYQGTIINPQTGAAEQASLQLYADGTALFLTSSGGPAKSSWGDRKVATENSAMQRTILYSPLVSALEPRECRGFFSL